MFGKNRARTSRAPLANFSLFRYTRTYLGTRQCNTLFWYTCTYLGTTQCNTLVACLQVPRVEILSLATRSHAAVSKIPKKGFSLDRGTCHNKGTSLSRQARRAGWSGSLGLDRSASYRRCKKRPRKNFHFS